MLLTRLHDLLDEVRQRAGPTFTGIGVIVATDPEALPILPLRTDARVEPGQALSDTLAAISVPASELHDGFHILSSDLRLELVSQYFAPPVNAARNLPTDRHAGARYMAALLGSGLPGVLATGVATTAQGIVLFQGGIEAKRSR